MKSYIQQSFILSLLLVSFVGCSQRIVDTTESQYRSELRKMSGGTFIMGQKGSHNDLDLPHTVTLDSFYIGTTEVTRQQFNAVMKRNTAEEDTKLPILVSWNDAARYCNELSRRENRTPCYNELFWTCNFRANGYRLPTEAEWEYACRGGTDGDYFWNKSGILYYQYRYIVDSAGQKVDRYSVMTANKDSLRIVAGKQFGLNRPLFTGDPYNMPDTNCAFESTFFNPDSASLYAWIATNSNGKLHQVALLKPNHFGLYDIVGNADEWCNDVHALKYYILSPSINPRGHTRPWYEVTGIWPTFRIVRGGDYMSSDQSLQSYHRGFAWEEKWAKHIHGFRVVLNNPNAREKR